MSSIYSKELFVIDTDAGLDDAQAVLMALAAPHVEVVGITTVFGNTNVQQATKNILRLLKVADRLDIPVYKGVDKQLIGQHVPEECGFFGYDGFGDVPDDNPPDINLTQTKHGVQALLDISQQYEGKITLIALGPLTNVAMAIRLDPDFGNRLKSCFIMGGNYKGQGNVTPCAEYNFYCDPHSANITLTELGCPITLICWELCLEHSFSWAWFSEIYDAPTKLAQFIRKMENKLIESFYKQHKKEKYELADQYAMAAAIDTRFVLKSASVYCVVETQGIHTKGQVAVDWSNKLQEPNVTVEIYHELRSNTSPICEFLKALEKDVIKSYKDFKQYVLCDEICMACAVDGSILTKDQHAYCAVELQGTISSGAMIVDRRNIQKKTPNSKIVLDINEEKLLSLLKKTY